MRKVKSLLTKFDVVFINIIKTNVIVYYYVLSKNKLGGQKRLKHAHNKTIRGDCGQLFTVK